MMANILFKRSLPTIIKLSCINTLLPFQYNCLGTPLNSAADNSSLAWWTDRKEKKQFYWSGDGVDSEKSESGGCQCGRDENCQNAERLCNCDAGNTTHWATDEGHLTNR
jgi:hypothetical protein